MSDPSKLERRLLAGISRLNRAHALIEPGDRIVVALSGGKDSWSLLHLLEVYRRRLPFDFSIVVVNIDQGQPGFSSASMREHLVRHRFEHHLVRADTYSVVTAAIPEGKAYCSLCSRLRRGILYDVAESLGATKIALGHHRDDVIETLLLNLFYSGQLKAMPPKLRSDDRRNTVIRPLAWLAEADLQAYADAQGFPIIPCSLCGSQEGLKRDRVRELLRSLELENPLVRKNLLAALGNVKASHLHDLSLREAVAAFAPVSEVAASPAVPLQRLRARVVRAERG